MVKDSQVLGGPDYEVVVVGAGVCGIYQLQRLVEYGVKTLLIEAGSDVGGTWFWNRYPGCRFDSESYTYGYSFSEELLKEWDWKELFSPQPENLRYLNYVVDKFELRRHMVFNQKVEAMIFDEKASVWRLRLVNGGELTSRFVVAALGLLSAPTLPRYEGLKSFKGEWTHTSYWPKEGIELAGKRVGVVGTGATGVQVIGEIADKVEQLIVFQRRPNWCVPAHNADITPEQMASIKDRYREIFELCSQTPGGFIHQPDRRSVFEVPRRERLALWERLYDEPGFGIWLSNFRETFVDEMANAELSEFVAGKIRSRVHDQNLAEKLIPRDHGFGVQRVPLETNYYEAYNQPNVQLVDLKETPIVCIKPKGIRTTADDYELDVIIYATGFDAVTGAFDRIDIRGVGGQRLREKWSQQPVTYLGMHVSGFPNFIMPTGPQNASGVTNFPRAIEYDVDWTTELLLYMWKHGYTREEASLQAEAAWGDEVKRSYDKMLLRKAQGWFTGYNSNVKGHEKGTIRYVAYNGGFPKYRKLLTECRETGYQGLLFS